MIVWTRAYRPFMMGGDVNGPVGIEVTPGEKLDLGKGFYGYAIVSPVTGKVYIAESETGAFVGSSLEQVRDDIASCNDIERMKNQITEAKEKAKKLDIISPESFWKLLSKGK